MIEALRWFVVLGSVAVIVIGTPQWPRWLREYPPEVVQGRLALAVLNVAMGYGTAEALYLEVPGGPRTYVSALGVLWTLYTVAWRPAAHLFHRRIHAAA
jgi:hypothetical protein